MKKITQHNARSATGTSPLHTSAKVAALLLPLAFANSATAATDLVEKAWAQGRILVQPKAGVSLNSFNQILNNHNLQAQANVALSAYSNGTSDAVDRRSRAHLISVPVQSELTLVKALSNDPSIEFAELDMRVSPSEISANDTYFSNAWHLNTMNLPQAWMTSQGENVVVAILDTGVDATQPDLVDNMLAGWNIVSGNSDISDVFGHGTKVAGVVAATSDNNSGVTSIAWHASILPVKVSNLSNGHAYWSDIARAVTWAADNGADIVNISYAISSSRSISNAAKYMKTKGGLVVSSSGNAGKDLNCTDNPDIITVSATTKSDTKASWSNYGLCIDVTAPGSGIWTTRAGGSYGAVNGTSFSSPAVAGVLALLKSANPNLSPDELEHILESTANKDMMTTEFSSYYGHGRVDAAAALAMAMDLDTTDQEAPSVVITSPTEDSVQATTFNIDVTATDDIGVTTVNLYANDKLVGSDSVFPFTFSIDSNDFADGDISFVAHAFDAAGNLGESLERRVNIAHQKVEVDTTAPTIDTPKLRNGKLVSGTFTISAVANDNIGLTSLQIFIDGKLKADSTNAKLSYNWDTTKGARGAHDIVVIATDAAGNTTKSVARVYVIVEVIGFKFFSKG